MTRPLTAPGRLVAGRYRLLSQIGGGGMGTVWLARDELLGRQVAVKQVLPPLHTDEREAERQRERALREGRIAARLSSPHAISVYDVAVEANQPWLVMEYLPSRSLAEVLQEDGLLRADQAAQIGAQVADALAATHAAGIVHRDVKPANILIGRGERVEGLVKITDFGISHAAGDVTLTQTGQITGTPAFLAPEVAQGEEPQAPSDVFSLGATLYTCLEGEPPFGMGDNALQLLHRVAGGDVTPPRYAAEMTRPLMRMLAADPVERPTMSQVRDELARLAAGRDGDTTTVLMARADLRTAPRRGTTRFPSAEPAAPTPAPPIPTPKKVPPTPPPSKPVAAEPADASKPVAEPVAAVAPVAAAAAAPVAAAVAKPATRPPVDPVDPVEPAEPGPRRRRALVPLAIAGVLVVIAAVVLAVVLLNQGGGNSPTARGTSSSTSSSAADRSTTAPTTSAPTTQSSAPATSSPPATSAAGNQAVVGAPTAADVRNFITGYYAMLPGNAAQAYDLTGPTLRAHESRSNYIAFWHRFSSVQLGPVTASDGSLVAHGQVTYVENGTPAPEQHTFTLVKGPDGRLLMDSDVQG